VGILIFKGLTAQRLYKSFGVKCLNVCIRLSKPTKMPANASKEQRHMSRPVAGLLWNLGSNPSRSTSFLSLSVQTGSGTYPDNFSPFVNGLEYSCDQLSDIVPRLRMDGAIPPVPNIPS
jgi:hypothetical protein